MAFSGYKFVKTVRAKESTPSGGKSLEKLQGMDLLREQCSKVGTRQVIIPINLTRCAEPVLALATTMSRAYNAQYLAVCGSMEPPALLNTLPNSPLMALVVLTPLMSPSF